MEQIEAEVIAWLDTFSQVSSMRDNPEATAREVATIVGVFTREGVSAQTVEAVFQHIKMTENSRAWPTAAMVYQALREIRKEKAQQSESIVGQARGDKYTLDGMERATLDNKVLPTAKRWLRMYPGLRHHAIQTLDYWGEPLVDDNGKEYKAAERAS
jgi:hypothetical protein